MRIQTRPLSLALATLLASMALAQTTKILELSGNVIHSTIADSVHVHVGQGETYPAVHLVLPLDSSGHFLGYADIESKQIDVTISTPCASRQSGPDYYMELGDSKGDTVTTGSVYLTCLGHVDCLNVPDGPNQPMTLCTLPGGGIGLWSLNCECSPEAEPYPFDRLRKKD